MARGVFRLPKDGSLNPEITAEPHATARRVRLPHFVGDVLDPCSVGSGFEPCNPCFDWPIEDRVVVAVVAKLASMHLKVSCSAACSEPHAAVALHMQLLLNHQMFNLLHYGETAG